ncbi:hypothetical protein ACWGH8_11415 [Nonomuraea muscovyensis]|uniref:Uncharacterized protein n=1 Tax=Nonomuraea muscovyensis TaxID=1124761 RepID=A0A7X0BZJ4_9ACTN|nr:hypothetical protein [Nonomuraea muscovyensis]MBB6343874.1 hypothetical protein [Nonomuraea muscovyensis]
MGARSEPDERVSSTGAAALPGMLGMGVAFNGLTGTVGTLAVEREDGTLPRAKALP